VPIKFLCVCGRALKARDELAGKQTRCPACSSVVKIPMPEPTKDEVGSWGDVELSPASLSDLQEMVEQKAETEDEATDGNQTVLTQDAQDLSSIAPTYPPTISIDLPPPVIEPEPVDLPRAPEEPWYYAFLSAYAVVCIVLGIIQFVLVFVAFLISQEARSSTYDTSSTPAAISGLTLGMSFGGMMATIGFSSAILLAVDIGQHVRAVSVDAQATKLIAQARGLER
jgi:hypothetical protein